MTFIADIEAQMTLLSTRNATLKKLDLNATQKTTAATYAAAIITNSYGTIESGASDIIALEHAVLVAIRHMRTEVPFKVDPNMERALDKLDTTLANEATRRRQLNNLPKQKNVDDVNLTSLFPFGLTQE